MVVIGNTVDKNLVSMCWKFGDRLCQRNVVVAILFTWFILFFVYSNKSEQNTFQPAKKLPDIQPETSVIYTSIYKHTYRTKPFPRKSEENLIETSPPIRTTTASQPIETTTVTPESLNQPEEVTTMEPLKSNTTKTILYFTTYFHMLDFQFGFGHKAFLDHKCPVNNCFATNNRSTLASFEDYDAIVFHIRDMENGHIPVPNQKHRKANQRYVMFLMESPLNDNFPYERYGNFFNWTISYRLDSDFVRPYAWIEPKAIEESRPPSASHHHNMTFPQGNATVIEEIKLKVQKFGKRKLAAWMVSNCGTHSERERYVEELQRFIPVDIYGECGPFKCDKHDEEGCMKLLESNYKFYLSFENSFCDDYVTEKFFKVMKYDMVPIVLGSGDYAKISPSRSFINIKDFPTIASLAEYIRYLDKNETAYYEYLEWKNYFRVIVDYGQSFCQLCQALNDESLPAKTYEDINSWWRTKAHCIKKGRFSWSKTVLENYVDTFKDSASQIMTMLTENRH